MPSSNRMRERDCKPDFVPRRIQVNPRGANHLSGPRGHLAINPGHEGGPPHSSHIRSCSRGVFLRRPLLDRPVVSYTAVSPLPRRTSRRGGIVSVALSVSSVCRKTSRHYAGTPCPTESGLSSPSWRTERFAVSFPDSFRKHQISMRPQYMQVTTVAERRASCIICAGSFRWQPEQTPFSTLTTAASLK